MIDFVHATGLTYIQHNGNMVKKNFTIRLSERRLNKLRLYAAQTDKTMTQVIEDCIDKLKLKEDTGD